MILLSETKLTEKCYQSYHPNLENYTFKKVKSKSYFGGVGVFYRDSLTCDIRRDLNCSEYKLFEMLWFDISVKTASEKTTIGIIYRHGGSPSIPYFTSRIESILNKLNREKNNYYIFGYWNINLLKIREITNISDFVNSMHSHSTLNLVNKPTRFPIGNQTEALLYLIMCGLTNHI